MMGPKEERCWEDFEASGTSQGLICRFEKLLFLVINTLVFRFIGKQTVLEIFQCDLVILYQIIECLLIHFNAELLT